ncbi:MAG: RDD family protein [Flavobacteriales bacterium]
MENYSTDYFNENKKLEFASFWKRFVAEIIDAVIFSFVNFILLGFYFFKELSLEELTYETLSTSPEFKEFTLISAFINIFHFTLMESSRYQATLGKSLMKIKVGSELGERIEFGQALIRNLGKAFFSLLGFVPFFSPYSATLGLIYLFTCLMVIWDMNKQALHDKLSKTFVFVKE